MLVRFPSVTWERVSARERRDKNSYGELTRTLLRNAPLPWREVEVDVDTDVDRAWLARAARFVRGLRGHELLTLYTYTTPAFADVLDMLRGGAQYAERAIAPAAELVASRAARHGAVAMWKADAKRGALGATMPAELAALVEAHLGAFGRIDFSDEATARAALGAWDGATDALVARAHAALGAPFARRVHAWYVRDRWQWGCLFAHAARALGGAAGGVRGARGAREGKRRGETAWARFRRVFGRVTAAGWRAILEQYVRDLDALFARAPALRAPMVVFRGTNASAEAARPRGGSYASTTMVRAVAHEFADKASPLVLSIDVPRGARPLPMCMVSRYPPEVELLLPREAA